MRAKLLGPFSVTLGERTAGPWARPSARRLCELVLVSPGRRTGRGEACEALFPGLGPAAAANALSRALSMARTALSALGEGALGLLSADRGRIWAGVDLEVDFEAHEQELRLGLSTPPGGRRDERLVLALGEEVLLLEDEAVLAPARRAGHTITELRCLTYLASARLRQHDVAVSKEMAPQNEELARAFIFPEYLAMAWAMLSWVAWKEGRLAEAELAGREALEQWRTGAAQYPFYWVALWPLIAVRLAEARCEEAVAAARELVGQDQMRLPVELETTVESAIAALGQRATRSREGGAGSGIEAGREAQLRLRPRSRRDRVGAFQ